jgi:hypothetical protein
MSFGTNNQGSLGFWTLDARLQALGIGYWVLVQSSFPSM